MTTNILTLTHKQITDLPNFIDFIKLAGTFSLIVDNETQQTPESFRDKYDGYYTFMQKHGNHQVLIDEVEQMFDLVKVREMTIDHPMPQKRKVLLLQLKRKV